MRIETLAWADLQDTGDAQTQLVLIAIARHANYDTGEAWPSQEQIADMAKCSVRTVRRHLDKLEADGLIERSERRRDNGGKSTDLITLVGYAEWVGALREGGNVKAPKKVKSPEDNLAGRASNPSDNLAGGTGQQVSGGTGQQVSAISEHLLEQLNESSAPERASDKGARAPVAPKPVAAVSIRQGESAFAAWIEHLKKIGRDDLATDARDAGEMLVSRRWPNEGDMPLSIPQPKGLSDVSKRMIGEPAQ
jgi:hypothetical protein